MPQGLAAAAPRHAALIGWGLVPSELQRIFENTREHEILPLTRCQIVHVLEYVVVSMLQKIHDKNTLSFLYCTHGTILILCLILASSRRKIS